MATRLVQGHRGSSEHYPENTILSYRMALAQGAGAVEADVRRSRDGAFVLCHDPTLERTAGVPVVVADACWATMATVDASYRLRFGDAFGDHPDCRVPSLDMLLDTFRGQDTFLVLHLKALLPRDLRPLVDFVTEREMTEQCHFFGPVGTVDEIKRYRPDCFTLNDGMPGIERYQDVLENAINKGHDAVSVSARCLEQDLRQMVAAIHAAGKIAHASYLAEDYEHGTQTLIDAGVDYILGNNVAKMVGVFDRNGLRQQWPR